MPPLPDLDIAPVDAQAPVFAAPGLSPLAPLSLASAGDTGEFEHRFGVEVSEVVHDPDLDEAVIAFANADFNQCEQSLSQLTGAGGARSQHAETWLVLFDLYRATGQQQHFETLASDYAHQFGWSAPQWFSLPKLVSDAVADANADGTSTGNSTTVATSAGSARNCWTSMRWRACARRRCRCPCPGSSTGRRCAASMPKRRRNCHRCSGTGASSSWRCAGCPARPCSPRCRRPPRPACAMPTRRSGRHAWTRCAWPTGPTSSTRRPSTTA